MFAETLMIQGNQLTGSITAAVCAERGLRFQQLATLIVDCVVECSCCDTCEGGTSNPGSPSSSPPCVTGSEVEAFGNCYGPATTSIDLTTVAVQGTIPTEIGLLTKLTTLMLEGNTGVTGTIPSEIGALTALSELQLGMTGMGGTLPEELFQLKELSELNLQKASFSGTIPESIRMLNSTLMDLYLNDNLFSGSVPEAFDYLTALGKFL